MKEDVKPAATARKVLLPASIRSGSSIPNLEIKITTKKLATNSDKPIGLNVAKYFISSAYKAIKNKSSGMLHRYMPLKSIEQTSMMIAFRVKKANAADLGVLKTFNKNLILPVGIFLIFSRISSSERLSEFSTLGDSTIFNLNTYLNFLNRYAQ